MLVANELNFDVARIDDELLDEHPVVAEARLGLVARGGEAVGHLRLAPGDAHALAATAGGGLDHDGIADLVGDLHRMFDVGDLADIAGNGRNLGLSGRLLALDLVAHGGDRLGVGTDENDPRLLQSDRKGLPLRQEAVARVHRLGAGLLAGFDDLVDEQIGLGGGRRTDVDGLIGHFHVQRLLIGIRIDGDGLDAHLARSLDDAAGDLATVGDQNFFEHNPLCSLGRQSH